MGYVTRTSITKVSVGQIVLASVSTVEGLRGVKYGDRSQNFNELEIADITHTKGRSYTARGTTSHYYALTFTDGTTTRVMPHAATVQVVSAPKVAPVAFEAPIGPLTAFEDVVARSAAANARVFG